MPMCEAEGLEDLSPAAKLAYRGLEEIGPASRPEISEETLLPESTARDALRSLSEADLIEEVGSPDPKPTYAVVDGGEER